MVELILYTGPDCELCERAIDVIYANLDSDSYRLEIRDVSLSPETKKAYGLRIPVLCKPAAGQELSWPFSAENLTTLVKS